MRRASSCVNRIIGAYRTGGAGGGHGFIVRPSGNFVCASPHALASFVFIAVTPLLHSEWLPWHAARWVTIIHSAETHHRPPLMCIVSKAG